MQNIVIGVLVVALLAGGVWYVLESRSAGEASQMTGSEMTDERMGDEPTSPATQRNLSGVGSFMSLLGFGDSIRCEFSSMVEGSISNGVFHTDGSQYRVEASTVTDGITFTSNVIDDGAYTYVWGGSPAGQMAMKMERQEMMAADETAGTADESAAPNSFDVEQEVTYECDAWQADASMFVPPSDIEFMDMSEMMQVSM